MSISTITARFGEHPTCDFKQITNDYTVHQSVAANGYTEKKLYWRSFQKGYDFCPIIRYDLSGLAPTTNIKKAVLRIPVSGYAPNSEGKTSETSVYQILDPDNTGMWNKEKITFKNKDEGVLWSNGTTSIFDPKNSIENENKIIWKSWEGSCNGRIYSVDITSMVKNWVSNPNSNLGLIFQIEAGTNCWVGSSISTDVLSHYLEITYDGERSEVNLDAPIQPNSLSAIFSKGQTFLTWEDPTSYVKETEEIRYNVYRSQSPITAENLDNAEFLGEMMRGEGSYFTEGVYGNYVFKGLDLSSKEQPFRI